MNEYWQARSAEMTIHRLIKEEQDAVDSYMGSADALRETYPQMAEQLESIAAEERAHIGELVAMHQILFPEFHEDVEKGMGEVQEEWDEIVDADIQDVENGDVTVVMTEDFDDLLDEDEDEAMYREVIPPQ